MNTATPTGPPPDFFKECETYRYAGTHLLLEFWDAKNLDDLELVEQALRDATLAADATLLEIRLHRFSPHGGISGVAIIGESHLSIHTWPEVGYAALDIFTCGKADPHKAVPVLRDAFQPERVQLSEHRRGMML